MSVDLIYILIIIIVILFSMTLHEAAHAYVSYWLGDDTARLSGRLTLNPIKHIDPFMTLLLPILLAISGAPIFGGAKPVPINSNNLKFDEWGMAMVAIAGPLVNFVISFLSIGLLAAVGSSEVGFLQQLLVTIASVNLGFFVFNLIPIPPLDGSRVLYALAPNFARRIMESMESFGIMIVFAILLIAGNNFELYISNAINFLLNVFGRFWGL